MENRGNQAFSGLQNGEIPGYVEERPFGAGASPLREARSERSRSRLEHPLEEGLKQHVARLLDTKTALAPCQTT